jgi:hypothetical protein
VEQIHPTGIPEIRAGVYAYCFASYIGRHFGGTMTNSEHAVIIHFSYGSTDLSRLYDLEDKLESALQLADSGEFDGNEMAADGSDGYLYLYGPDADILFETIKPVLEAAAFMKGAKAKLRYGPPKDGTREVEIEIGT